MASKWQLSRWIWCGLNKMTQGCRRHYPLCFLLWSVAFTQMEQWESPASESELTCPLPNAPQENFNENPSSFPLRLWFVVLPRGQVRMMVCRAPPLTSPNAVRIIAQNQLLVWGQSVSGDPSSPFPRLVFAGCSLRHGWLDRSLREGMDRGFRRGQSLCLPSQLPDHPLLSLGLPQPPYGCEIGKRVSWEALLQCLRCLGRCSRILIWLTNGIGVGNT